MSQPRVENIELVRGDDFGATFTFDQPVSAFSEMRFTIRESWATTETDNTTAALSKTLSATGTYTADLDITDEEALALSLDQYVYDVQIITTGGRKYTSQRGILRMTPDASR